MAYSYDRRAYTPRRRQRGMAKLKSQRYYRKKRQQIKRRSKQWRRTHKSKIRQYERRRKAAPSLYRLRNASTEGAIEFSDSSMETDDVGFIDSINLATGEIHTEFIRDNGETYEKTYDLFEWLDCAAFLFKDDEEALLTVLDEAFGSEEDGEDGEEDDDGVAFQVAARFTMTPKRKA